MPRTFFSSDSHIGHASILSPRFDRPRPFPSIEAHDEALVAAWNAVVRPDDIVWHLGDFAYKCRLEYAAAVFSRLKGRKRLVRGNHDFGLGERLAWDGPVVDVVLVQVQDPGMTAPKQAFLSHYGIESGRACTEATFISTAIPTAAYPARVPVSTSASIAGTGLPSRFPTSSGGWRRHPRPLFPPDEALGLIAARARR